IGSVRLTERCVKHDPVTEDEFNMIHNIVNEQIHNIVNVWHFKPKHFVGVAGTVTTLAAINFQLNIYDSELVDNSILARSQIAKIVDELKTKTIQERRLMPGLKPERADVILSGAIILLAFMRQVNFEKVIVSDRGLRFGLLLKFFGERGL
ncbi:MAG: Ppx/GppA family phosphatase, partial [bacterium]